MVNDNDSSVSPADSGAKLTPFDKLSREIARRDIMGDFEHLSHGSRLYTLETNWKSSIIIDDFKAREVQTLTEFERAVADPDTDFIYIPSSALITREGIERVCDRNALSKIIFKET